MEHGTRLAYLVSHPIQYQAPLLRLLANEPNIDLTVFFLSDFSARSYVDVGFGRPVTWDVDLLSGYRHEVLPALGGSERVTRVRPFSHGVAPMIRPDRFDALWVHGYAHPVMLAAVAVAHARGVPVLLRGESHASAPRSAPGRVARSLVLTRLFRLADAFLAIGSRNRDYYLAHGVPANRIFSVPYAVDNDFFATQASLAAPRREELRAELGLRPGQHVVLVAGKLIDRKRPGDVLEAYADVVGGSSSSPASLVFAGDGHLKPALVQRAERLGLADVMFAGFRGQREMAGLYELANVVVLPSSAEPWGLVVNEAMAAGKPAIVSDAVGCAGDLVVDGSTGFVTPVGDVSALAARMRLLLGDERLRTTMGKAARERVAQWSFTADVAGLREALETVIPRRASGLSR